MALDPLDIARQRQDHERRQLRNRQAAEDERADVRWLMGSTQGRRLAWRMLQRSGMFRSSFSNDAMQMAFAEGGRNSGLALLAQILDAAPEQYPVMMDEARKREDDERSGNDQ